MSAERLVLATGIALFAASGVLTILTVRFFVRNDIRGVRDDLSGRSRQRGLESSSHATSRMRSSAGRDSSWGIPMAGEDLSGSRSMADEREGDEVPTVVDAGTAVSPAAHFVVLRREVVLNSNEVISIGGEEQ